MWKFHSDSSLNKNVIGYYNDIINWFTSINTSSNLRLFTNCLSGCNDRDGVGDINYTMVLKNNDNLFFLCIKIFKYG